MGYIDIHSHILPNMDDGSRSVKQSLSMLRIAYEQGITMIIATPHNMPGKGCPEAGLVRESVARLAEAAAGEGLPVQILCGTEYYYREEVLTLLESGKGITLGNSASVLVEFDPVVDRVYFCNALKDILGIGYRPVVAHAERYGKVLSDISLIRNLRKMGVFFQVNSASITGDNGRQARKDVKTLLGQALVDFVAMDAHSDGRRAPYIMKCAGILSRRYGREYAGRLLCGNAERYLI